MTVTIILISLCIAYGLVLYLWHKRISWRLNETIATQIKYFHYGLTFLVLVSVSLSLIDNLSFSGQWTTRVIIIGFLISGIFIFPLTNWSKKRKFEKYYFKVFSFLPLLTGLFALIPFLGIIIIVSLLGQLLDPVDKIYYEDNKMRIQSSFVGVLGPNDLLIYEKKGLLKKRLNDSHKIFRYAADVDSVHVLNEKDSTLIIMYSEDVVMDTLRIKAIE